ncbi:MAG: hypothetical protein WBE68_08080 [Candidatus Nitrosopolaris sp.]
MVDPLHYNQRHQLTIAKQVSVESRNESHDIRLLVVNNIARFFREAKHKNYAAGISKETAGLLCKVCARNRIALTCSGDANITSRVIPNSLISYTIALIGLCISAVLALVN